MMSLRRWLSVLRGRSIDPVRVALLRVKHEDGRATLEYFGVRACTEWPRQATMHKLQRVCRSRESASGAKR